MASAAPTWTHSIHGLLQVIALCIGTQHSIQDVDNYHLNVINVLYWSRPDYSNVASLGKARNKLRPLNIPEQSPLAGQEVPQKRQKYPGREASCCIQG